MIENQPSQIIGVGIDIVQIERFRKILLTDRFYEKYFSKKERDYCFEKPDPFPHLAARFAAKEAFLKASPIPFAYDAIEVIHSENGKPHLAIAEQNFLYSVSVSLSHTSSDAIAVVILSHSK